MRQTYIAMTCSSCGYVVSTATPGALAGAYLTHREHAHAEMDKPLLVTLADLALGRKRLG